MPTGDPEQALARARQQLATLESLQVPAAERPAMPGLIRSSRALVKLCEKALAYEQSLAPKPNIREDGGQ